MTDAEKAKQELANLKMASQKFYSSKAGKAQLKWLDEFEANLTREATMGNDAVVRISCLDQAKGVRAFRAYIESLTRD